MHVVWRETRMGKRQRQSLPHISQRWDTGTATEMETESLGARKPARDPLKSTRALVGVHKLAGQTGKQTQLTSHKMTACQWQIVPNRNGKQMPASGREMPTEKCRRKAGRRRSTRSLAEWKQQLCKFCTSANLLSWKRRSQHEQCGRWEMKILMPSNQMCHGAYA